MEIWRLQNRELGLRLGRTEHPGLVLKAATLTLQGLWEGWPIRFTHAVPAFKGARQPVYE
jgi:hypothetical protein